MSNDIDWHGKSRQPCPTCAHGPKDTALGITRRDDGTFIGHCFRCGAVYFSDDRQPRVRSTPPARAVAPAKRETLSDYGRELWGACRPLSGPALAYLKARGCRIPPADGDLRWHPDLKHSDDYSGPALVGLITAAADHRKWMSLHFTWIRADGTKAEVTPPRRYLSGHAKAAGVVRLWPDDCVAESLGIAEGTETALSLAHYHAPAWACLDAANLGAFEVLAGIEQLVIGVDNDAAGKAAAAACAHRWLAAGVHVQAVASITEGEDLNDAIEVPRAA